MHPVLESRVFGYLFETFAFQPREVHSKDGVVVVVRGQLSGYAPDQFFNELVDIHPRFLDNLDPNYSYIFVRFWL